MPNNSTNSLVERAWRGALVLCGIVVLLTLAVDMIRRIWVDLVVTVGVITVIAVAVSAILSWRRRNRW